MSKSKYGFYQEASLSQKLSFSFPEYVEYAGSDAETSLAIARIKVLVEFGFLPKPEKKNTTALILAILNEERKARFATSEKTNEITKMGLQMPKSENLISKFDEEE